MVVMDAGYHLIKSNGPAQHLIRLFVKNAAALKPPLNLYEMLFDPELTRPFIQNWNFWHDSFSRASIGSRSCVPTMSAMQFAGSLIVLPGYPGKLARARLYDNQ